MSHLIFDSDIPSWTSLHLPYASQILFFWTKQPQRGNYKVSRSSAGWSNETHSTLQVSILPPAQARPPLGPTGVPLCHECGARRSLPSMWVDMKKFIPWFIKQFSSWTWWLRRGNAHTCLSVGIQICAKSEWRIWAGRSRDVQKDQVFCASD